MEITEFCIEKGVSINDDVEVVALSTMSKEIFEFAIAAWYFPWSQHREFRDILLYECFKRWLKTPNMDSKVTESEVRSLAEFLFEHGAKSPAEYRQGSPSAMTCVNACPAALHLGRRVQNGHPHWGHQWIDYIPFQNEDQIELLLSRSAGAKLPERLM